MTGGVVIFQGPCLRHGKLWSSLLLSFDNSVRARPAAVVEPGPTVAAISQLIGVAEDGGLVGAGSMNPPASSEGEFVE